MKGRSDKRKEIIQTLNGISNQVRVKKGCLNVKSYQAIDDENVFCLVEEWKTKPDMDEYMNSQLYAALLGISTILAEKPEVKILVEEGSRNEGTKENGQVPF
jgi:quinol monooxygenase YgiN